MTSVGMMSNMPAVVLLRTRIVLSEDAFAELALWQVPRPVKGSPHHYKYRLAYVVRGECVVRHDNEAGKGDHRHYGAREGGYAFETAEKLIADFRRDIARWNRENRDA